MLPEHLRAADAGVDRDGLGARGLGTRDAGVHAVRRGRPTASSAGLVDLLADHDDALLAAYVDDETAVSYDRLRGALATQTKQALVHPVFFGSAITGAGVDALMTGITELLPAAEGDADAPVSGTRLQGRTRAGGGEDRLRPDVLRHGADARPAASSAG